MESPGRGAAVLPTVIRIWRPMTAVSKMRRRLFAVAACVAALVFFCIYVLTEQDPAQTTDLSTSAYERVANEEARSEAAEGASDDESLSTGVTIPSPSVAEWLLGIAGIRKWAHTVEFFAFGVPVAAALLLWWRRPELTGARMLVSFAISACASLFDQTHKLFVPGREFDASDLVFDVLGYGVGIVLMFGVVGIVRCYMRCRIARHA